MENGSLNPVNNTGSAEVSGTEKLTYSVVVKKAAGISRTNDPIKLRDLRDDADAVIADLKEQIHETDQAIATSADELDKLALKSEVKDMKTQITRMDGLKEKIAVRVKELLKG